jgi:hypothetical protein
LARVAEQERLISDEEDLLAPTFYLAKGLADWLYETVNTHISTHPNWTF